MPLVSQKIITKHMARKIAGSGLKYNHVRLIYLRGGLDGMASVFGAKDNAKKARVTASKKILKRIEEYIAKSS
jgi:hypothetical protein